MVDMAHHGHDGRARNQIASGIVDQPAQTFEHVGFGHALHRMAELGRHQLRRVGVDGVVGRHHHAALHQHLDDVDAAARHAVGEFGNRDGFGNDHFARAGDRGRLLLAMGAVELAPVGRERTHAVVVFGKRARDGELAGAAAARRRLAGGRRLGRRLAALLGRDLFFFFGEVAGALGGRRDLNRRRRRFRLPFPSGGGRLPVRRGGGLPLRRPCGLLLRLCAFPPLRARGACALLRPRGARHLPRRACAALLRRISRR